MTPPNSAAPPAPRKNHIWYSPLSRPRLWADETSSTAAFPPTQMPDQAVPHSSRENSSGPGPRPMAKMRVEIAPRKREAASTRRRGRRS